MKLTTLKFMRPICKTTQRRIRMPVCAGAYISVILWLHFGTHSNRVLFVCVMLWSLMLLLFLLLLQHCTISGAHFQSNPGDCNHSVISFLCRTTKAHYSAVLQCYCYRLLQFRFVRPADNKTLTHPMLQHSTALPWSSSLCGRAVCTFPHFRVHDDGPG